MMLGLGDYESSSEDEAEKRQSPFVSKQELKTSQVEVSQTQLNAESPLVAQPTLGDTVANRELSGPVLGPMHETKPQDGQSTRILLHDLTLPPVPNLDIPSSPPGSPNPTANAKLAHFLSLKKQGIHFNDKLASSISLKNPSLLGQMMEHADIDDQAQYSTSIPFSIHDLPSWGYKEELLKAQRQLNAKSEESRVNGQRDTIEFISDSRRPSSTSPKHRLR
ncbi:hypothetical protein BDW74DRAFT_94837 [Aspergillus multicolor]|uniref:HCNGP domain-containing protein n=1 Tax=Aspergillus multicolor TaxID=41759 RepID=UPI003CCCB4A4